MKKTRLLMLLVSVCVVLVLAACGAPAPAPSVTYTSPDRGEDATYSSPDRGEDATYSSSDREDDAVYTQAATPAAAPAEPIKWGIILELTGFGADYGAEAKMAIEMRLEEANYEAGGRPIEVIWEDDATTPAVALEKAKKLVEADGVDFIQGPIWSDAHLVMAPYLAETNTLANALESSTWELREYGNWVVFTGTSRSYSTPLGDWLYNEGYRTATSLSADYAFGYEVVGGPLDKFVERGGTVIQEQWVPYGTIDYGPFITALDDEADVFVCWQAGADMQRLMTQYYEFGGKIPVAMPSCSSIRSEQMAEVGEDMLGIVGVDTYSWTLDYPANLKFVRAFEAKFGKKPQMVHSTAYTVTSYLLAGIEATGGDTSIEVLRPAILNLELFTPHGPLTFSPSGYAISPRVMVEAKMVDGQYTWDAIQIFPGERDPRDQ